MFSKEDNLFGTLLLLFVQLSHRAKYVLPRKALTQLWWCKNFLFFLIKKRFEKKNTRRRNRRRRSEKKEKPLKGKIEVFIDFFINIKLLVRNRQPGRIEVAFFFFQSFLKVQKLFYKSNTFIYNRFLLDDKFTMKM